MIKLGNVIEYYKSLHTKNGSKRGLSAYYTLYIYIPAVRIFVRKVHSIR